MWCCNFLLLFSLQCDQDCAPILQREFFAPNVPDVTGRVPGFFEYCGQRGDFYC